MKVSVDAHQIMTSRSAPLDCLKSRMSSRSCSARSILFLPFLTLGPSSFLTQRLSKTASRGLILDRKGLTWSSSETSSTPALRAAEYMSSSKMSQPVKTRSLSPAKGTKSLILGERPSVRLPRRIVPIWVSDPIGLEIPSRTASTPATNVVATAPMPGIMIPSLPFAGLISPGAGCVFLFFLLVGMLSVRFIKESTNLLSSRNHHMYCNCWSAKGRVHVLCGNLKDSLERHGYGKSCGCDWKFQRHRSADQRRAGAERPSRGRDHAQSCK